MSTGSSQDATPDDLGRRKSKLIARIKQRLMAAERELLEGEAALARQRESELAHEAAVRNAQTEAQRARDEERSSAAILAALEEQLRLLDEGLLEER